MTARNILGTVMATAVLACGACTPAAVSDPREPADRTGASEVPGSRPSHGRSVNLPETTRCSDVRLPEGGLGEADFNVDRAHQRLTIKFSDKRNGSYRNVTYTVRYEADPSCASTPRMAELISRVIPGPEPCTRG